MDNFEFYDISSAAVSEPDYHEEQVREQQLRIQQQMNAPAPSRPSGPTGTAPQPYQKLNMISSKEAQELKSGSSSTSGGPIAPGPIVAKKEPKKVDPEMIKEFLDGNKNPGMALNEFCQKQRLSISFQEAAPLSWGTYSNQKFAFVAVVDGIKHKQGSGRTKKEAKANAAKIALAMLLGLGEEDVQQPELGTVIYDLRGRKTIMMDAESKMYSSSMAAPTQAADMPSFSTGGHFQLNYNNAVTLTSEEAWRKPKQEVYADYQAKKEAAELERQNTPFVTAGGDNLYPNGQDYSTMEQSSYTQQSNTQMSRPSTTCRAEVAGARPDPNAALYLKETQPDDKISTFQFPESNNEVKSYGEGGGSAFPTNRRRNLPEGVSPFAALREGKDHARSEPMTLVTSVGMAHLKKKADTDVKRPPRPGLQLGDLIPSDQPTSSSIQSIKKPSKQSANPGTSMGYQDKTNNTTMPLQASPQLRKRPDVPQSVGPAEPVWPRNPTGLNQPMRPNMSGSMSQPVRQNLAQPVRQNLTQRKNIAQPVEPTYPREAGVNQLYQTPSMPLDFAKVQLTKADNIASVARRIPSIGMPFPGCHGISDQTSYAAFVIQPSPNLPGQIISLGTGCSFVDAKKLAPDGRTVIDCHGLVIAKRGFQRFLHRELKSFFQGFQGSIFVGKRGSRLLSIKPDIKFHLYMNAAPHGDAVRFLTDANELTEVSEEEMFIMSSGEHYPVFLEDTDYGCLSMKTQVQDKVKSTRSTVSSATLDNLKESMCVMSGSDKLLMWNVLGVQGCLLNFFMEPIYLESIILGSQYDHGHLSRAVCCRLDDALTGQLPEGFSVHHPQLLRKACMPNLTPEQPDDDSLNWSYEDALFEVVDPKKGRTTASSPFKTGTIGASRVCKASFFSRFKTARDVAQRHDLAYATTYTEAKALNKNYKTAKQMVTQHLTLKGYGNWIHLPQELDREKSRVLEAGRNRRTWEKTARVSMDWKLNAHRHRERAREDPLLKQTEDN